MIKRALWACLLLCWLPLAAAWEAAPWDAAPPFYAADAANNFQGDYQGDGLRLSLQHQGAGHYQGWLLSSAGRYAVQGEARGDELRGLWYQGQQAQHWRLLKSLSGFVLESEQGRWRLQRLVGGTAAWDEGSSFAPWPMASQQGLLETMQTQALRAGGEFRLFMLRLQRWQAGEMNDAQAALLAERYVLPQTEFLAQQWRQLASVAMQVQAHPRWRPQDRAWLQEFVDIAQQGALLFEDWQAMLLHMRELAQQGDQVALAQWGEQQVPDLIRRSYAYVRPLGLMLQAARRLNTTVDIHPESAWSMQGGAAWGSAMMFYAQKMMRFMARMLQNLEP